MIVGCVASEEMLRRCARKAPAHCDLIEVRLDLVGLCGGKWRDLCGLAQQRGRPVLLTIRDHREGGAWSGNESDRLDLYLSAMPSVSAVDMEIDSPSLSALAAAARKRRVTVVGSFHDFQSTPKLDRLVAVEDRGRRAGAQVVKIASTVAKAADLARLFAMLANTKGPICLLGMGERGAISRIALPCAGSCLAYGALGVATAPGQMTCRQMSKEFVRWNIRNV